MRKQLGRLPIHGSLQKVFLFSFILTTILLASLTFHVLANQSPPQNQLSASTSAQTPSLTSVEYLLKNSLQPQRSISATLPPPKQDPCLHCHITGENKNLWTPLARWAIFGTMGLIFAFGMYRTGSVILNRKTWKPLTNRTVEWVDERYEISEPLTKVLRKPVPKYALRWFYCLGGITAFLFVVQGVTGIMLAFYYKPTPEAAYASIQFIETQVRFGAAIRAIHHWAANGMIIMCTAHMLRVFIMGAYKNPREMNWVSGVLLLVNYRWFRDCRFNSDYRQSCPGVSPCWLECHRRDSKPLLRFACDHHPNFDSDLYVCPFPDGAPSRCHAPAIT
jgi:hypothetical protein